MHKGFFKDLLIKCGDYSSFFFLQVEKMIYAAFDAAKPDERELSNGLRHMAMKEVNIC
jgi:hypothetical protein